MNNEVYGMLFHPSIKTCKNYEKQWLKTIKAKLTIRIQYNLIDDLT